ncbi:MAG: PAS domain S-box protein, partial [Burkholderiales bacterium]
MSAVLDHTEALREAALAVSTAEGEQAFDQLVTALARILGVEYALISVYIEPHRTHLRTLATFFGGRLAKNVEYPVAGTPCEQAIGRSFGYFPRGVARQYPGDGLLADHRIEGYAATTLHDARGAPIGALTVMSSGEMPDAGLAEALLNIFAARVSAEIGRRRSEASYRAIFENAETAIIVLDIDNGAIVDVNPKACANYGYTAEEFRRRTADELSSGVPPYTGAMAMQAIARARDGEVLRGEWHRRNKDGSLHWDEVTLKRVEIAGRPHILVASREITGRKAAEEALRASEEQYRAIFNASTDSLTLRDAEFRIVDVNAAYEKMSGLPREQVLGATELTVDVLDVRDWRREVHDRAIAGEQLRIESEARRRDGSRFRVEVLVLPMQYRGAPHALYVARDITEREQAEAARRASEEQYRAIFNASSDALVLRDARFRIVDVNAAYEQMGGRRREEVIGLTDLTLTRDATTLEARRRLHEQAIAGKPIRFEADGRRPDGAPYVIEVRGVPMSYRGEPHVLYIGRDVTEAKTAERALRASEEQYRAIFNASVDGMLLWDAEHRVVDVNEAFLALHGFAREELVGRTEPLFLPPELRGQCAQLLPGVLAGKPCALQARSRHKDGYDFDVEIHGIPMRYRGRPHVLIILRDVTARHRAETQLRASEEQYRAIFNSTADALVLRDAEFRIVDVNAAYEAMSGRRRADALGQVGLTISGDENLEERRALHARALAGEAVRFEAEGRQADGRAFVLEVRGLPIAYGGRPHVLYIGRDVTEAKTAERALRASEEQYRAIFTAAADAFVLRDAQFRVVDLNPAYEALAGVRREQVLGETQPLVKFIESEQERLALHRRVLAGETVRLEVDSERRDGSRFRLELQAVPMQYGGEPHVLYVARNITERKQAEEALRASWEQYRSIFNASADSLVLRDEEFRIVDVNPAYEAMSGRGRAEAMGRKDVTMSDPALAGRIRELHARALAGEAVSWEAQARRKGGAPFHIEVRGVPVRHQGRPHVLYIGRDVTEAKLAERELRASEEQYRAIFNASFDGMIIRTLEGEIVDVNPALLAMYGYTREELVGRTFGPIIPEKRAAGFREYLAEVASGRPYRTESKVRRKDGSTVHIEVLGSPVTYRGQPHVLSVVRDITERRAREAEREQLEAQLRQAQKMEAIGQLTGGIAHDFNNILQGVLGNLVLAEERQAGLGDAKLGRYLERAHAAWQRARDLIRQMLTFSRGQSGERRPVALGALLAEATRLLRPTLPATLELRTELVDGLPAALADTVQMEQVLLNLCINARDAMQGEGAITLGARAGEHRGAVCASCRQRVEGRYLELNVRDTGPGIPTEIRERMFDPFFSTKEVGRGSGMGLAMVHGIVHQHGGHVLVENAEGGGARFRILLPAAEAADAAAGAGEEARNRAARPQLGGRVLVADDEQSIRELLGELLEGWGLEVVACADGAEARDAFAEDPQSFDLVVTDQTMPRLTGLQLAKLVTRMRPGIPVILCTGYGEELKAR